MMSAREQFDQFWISRQCHDNAIPSNPPSLTCWDSNGEPKSDEAIRNELDSCRRRIAYFKERIESEKICEEFCERLLVDLNAKKCVTKPRASVREHIATANECQATSKTVSLRRCLKTSELERQNGNFLAQSNEITLKGIVCTSEIQQTELVSIGRQNEDKLQAKDQEDVESSEDDSVANVIAIRQSVSKVSQFCIDGGSARQQLELQAQRLSVRFSCLYDKKDSHLVSLGVMNTDLKTIEESLPSPSVAAIGNSLFQTTL